MAASAARESAREAHAAEWRNAERPIVKALHSAGVEVDSVWDLINTSTPYPRALPVLIEHLERGKYPDRVNEGLARALAVKPSVQYWERLVTLYKMANESDERDGLAAALAACATKEQIDSLIELITSPSSGKNRVLFVKPILALAGARGEVLIDSLKSDPVVGQEATARRAETMRRRRTRNKL
ncbi:hypothetical protein [Rhodoglobus sp.]